MLTSQKLIEYLQVMQEKTGYPLRVAVEIGDNLADLKDNHLFTPSNEKEKIGVLSIESPELTRDILRAEESATLINAIYDELIGIDTSELSTAESNIIRKIKRYYLAC